MRASAQFVSLVPNNSGDGRGLVIHKQRIRRTILLAAAVSLVGLRPGILLADDRLRVVGWGMVPRGEVGLIFAAAGRQLGVMDDAMFSMIVIMVILTTLLTPPVLTGLLRRRAG